MIVALRPDGLRGLLSVVPALRALREAHPRESVCVAAPEPLRPLALLAGVGLLHVRAGEPLPLEAHGAKLLVNLQDGGPGSHRLALAARPRRLVAFAHPDVPETAGMPAWRDGEGEVQRWCRLLEETGTPADPARVELGEPRRAVPDCARGATLIHPGSTGTAWRWPAAEFAAVAAAEAENGREVVVTGGAREARLARAVASHAGLPETAVVAGHVDLLELAALVAAAGRVVCGDPAIAQLAVALGVPSVLVLDAAPGESWAPPADLADRHVVLRPRRFARQGGEAGSGVPAAQVSAALDALAEPLSVA